jgi:hypothetical protein
LAKSLSVGLPLLLASTAIAQYPTLSLEVVAINGMPLKTPVGKLTAAPGDTLKAEIFLRDWSPEGDVLRAYQAAVDQYSFNSGTTGSIKPRAYDETSAQGLKNPENCYVNASDPRFAHAGLETIPIADSVNYRWASVLLDSDEAPLCENDGTKFYVGTLILEVSEDARGPFTIRLNEEPNSCSLRNPGNKPIEPLDYEHLEIEVTDGAAVVRIRTSDPPNNAVDARSAMTASAGTRSVGFDFSGDPNGVTPSDFELYDSSGNAPKVTRVAVDGSTATLSLSKGLTPGAWTRIIHTPSQTFVNIACLPGDVDNDGNIRAGDLATLLTDLNRGGTLPLYQTDINRDGKLDVTDALRMIDLLADPDVFRSRLPG